MRLLTVKQVRKRLNVSRALAYKLISDETLRCVRIGSAIRVDERELEEFISGSKAPCSRPKGPSGGRGAGGGFRHLDAGRLRKAWREESEQRESEAENDGREGRR